MISVFFMISHFHLVIAAWDFSFRFVFGFGFGFVAATIITFMIIMWMLKLF